MKKIIVWLALPLIATSCLTVEIKRSSAGNARPNSVQLADNLVISSGRAVEIEVLNDVSVFFPASFRIESREQVIYIDPLHIDQTAPADYIFLTHGHEDHFSPPDIKKLIGQDTVVIGPPRVIKQLPGLNTRTVKPGETLIWQGVTCETVPAYNLNPIFLWVYAHAQQEGNVGYILTIEGTRIYHAGDTDFVPELRQLRDIDVALVPLDEDGGKLTMDVRQAADLINFIRPHIAIPMHYEVGKQLPERFERLVDDGIAVKIMK